MYDVLPYYLAKILAEIPVFIFVPLLFNLITFWLIGYNQTVEQFMKFWLVFSMNTFCAVSLGFFVSCAIKNGTIAVQMAPMLAMPIILVGGFYSNTEEMPIYIEVASYVSPIMYSFQNLAIL